MTDRATDLVLVEGNPSDGSGVVRFTRDEIDMLGGNRADFVIVDEYAALEPLPLADIGGRLLTITSLVHSLFVEKAEEFIVRCVEAGFAQVEMMESLHPRRTINPDRYLPRSKYTKAHEGRREIARRAKRLKGKS